MSKTFSKHYTLRHIMKSSLLICSLSYFHDVFIFSVSERKPKNYKLQKKSNISTKWWMFKKIFTSNGKSTFLMNRPFVVADVHWFSDASLEMNLWKMFQQRMNVMVSPLAFSCCSQLWLVIIPMSPTECQWVKYIY